MLRLPAKKRPVLRIHVFSLHVHCLSSAGETYKIANVSEVEFTDITIGLPTMRAATNNKDIFSTIRERSATSDYGSRNQPVPVQAGAVLVDSR